MCKLVKKKRETCVTTIIDPAIQNNKIFGVQWLLIKINFFFFLTIGILPTL